MIKKINLMILSILLYNLNIFGLGTSHFKFDNFTLFNTGDLNNVVLDETGKMFLSPTLKKINTDIYTYIWDIKEDSKGNIYFATGNNGIVYKLTKNNKIVKFFETASVAAFKLLIDKNDNIYISTLTKGLIYKVSPSGKGTVFYIFKNKVVWDMIFNKNNNIVLATGSPGVLYELNVKTKKLKELALVKEMNIVSVAKDKDKIYFGTADNGVIYELGNKNKLKVIFESEEQEIHSLIVKNNIIYAGTSDKEMKLPNFNKFNKFNKQQKNNSDKNNYKSEMDKINKQLKKYRGIINKLYEIIPGKEINKIIESDNNTFLSMAFDNNGELYIGTGDDGVIFKYNKEKKVEKLLQLDAQQVTSLYKTKNGELYIGTGNLGDLYKMKIIYSKKGEYISDVLNANGFAKWGKINIDYEKFKETDIAVYTRTGNVKNVDDTWSDWNKLSTLNGLYIISPAAQYIQYKILFTTKNINKTPIVYSIDIPYVVKNRTPEVLNINLKKGKSLNNKYKSKNNNIKKLIDSDFSLTLTWKSEDRDKDKLIYSIWASPVKTGNWILIKNNVTDMYFKFDSRYLPDGIYRFKVIADDIPSNTLETHLQGNKISKKYIIDSTPPSFSNLKIKKLKNDKYVITFKVKDNYSNIENVSYLDGIYKWINIFPMDDIFDSKLENFSFIYKYNPLRAGIVIFKAMDSEGNITTKYTKIKK